MAVFKCKICGGTLEINVGETVATCEYCGTKQTLPKLDDEKKANLFDRANHFRRNNDFDKAMGIYEQILNEDTEDAESYWSIVLCRYGIEYVEDPSSRKRVPTVNRAQFTSVFDDEDYKSAIKYADSYQKNIYEAEAATINEIQKGILAISQKEDPFDVFICYKETDNNGRRTQDSVLATELYHELTKEGFKVFFSRITLEDKLGVAYEPYIFAALHSAKVMVALGTKPEHFNAVWVKNEWSRYLSLIKNGANKILIPAYRDMDPYDLPEEFSHLQAQDMSKLGFMQDLVRGIKKLVSADTSSGVKETVVVQNAASGNASALVKRGFLALEDGEWEKADEFFEQALNQNAEDAQAYLGKLMAELKVSKQENLIECREPFENMSNYQKAVRFADDNLKKTLKGYVLSISERNKLEQTRTTYASAMQKMKTATTEERFLAAATEFESISDYKNSKELAEECRRKIDEIRLKLQEEYAQKKLVEENERLEQIRIEEQKRNENELRKKKNQKMTLIITAIVAIVLIFAMVLNMVIIPSIKYSEAQELLDNGDNVQAALKFGEITKYKDSKEKSFSLWNEIIQKDTIRAGDYRALGLKTDGTVVAVGNNTWGECDVNDWTDIVAIDSIHDHTIGLKSNGTVVAVGDSYDGECDVDKWTDIVAISLGGYHTFGLKANGTVKFTEYLGWNNKYADKCDVSDWTDIVAISAGSNHTVGLKVDGTVVATEYFGNPKYYNGECAINKWTDIIDISAGSDWTVGLKADGTVIATGANTDDRLNFKGWTDIVDVSIEDDYTIGLKSNGTVVATGRNAHGRCDINDWTNIVAIDTGYYHTVGLKADGTVVAVGYNDNGRCNVNSWTDIVAIYAGDYYTIGLKSDGTIVVAGDEYISPFNPDSWTNIKLP